MSSPHGAVTGRRVLLAGSTGLVGRELVRLLLDDTTVASVTALVRREPAATAPNPRLHYRVVDFDRLSQHADLFAVDQVFSALGTTIKQAGSQDAFRRVDFDYPREAARLGAAGGARHFLLVSALGATARSSIFYNRVKGELEDAVTAMGFRAVTMARPSLLLGDRGETRRVEEIFRKLAWLSPSRLKPVHARQVARALVTAAHEDRPGVRILENRELIRQPM